MFSWITGPRPVALEDLKPESAYESTFIEPPETPAHQFAVKAFKHALFGTVAPVDTGDATERTEKKTQLEVISKDFKLRPPRDEAPPLSPSKQPCGILMTPGTISRGRKTVSFGSQVMDNEGKRGNISRSGIPNDCPGKFPSPWTPGTQLKLDPSSNERPRTKLTEALLDARTTIQPASKETSRARDDIDITIDMGSPRSESGRYWKAQFEAYAAQSEKEMKKIIAKQQLAKKFAMKKDGEVNEIATKLDHERKWFKQREQELEQQSQDYEQRLQRIVADKKSAEIEIEALKARIGSLEKLLSSASSELSQNKPSFDIYEDSSRDVSKLLGKQEQIVGSTLHPSFSMATSEKENASPTSRVSRYQRTSELSLQINTHSKVDHQKPLQLDKTSPERIQKPERGSYRAQPRPVSIPAPVSRILEQPPTTNQDDKPRQSPTIALPSSPLPTGSPDPWMQVDESSIAEHDKLALPVSTGQPYSRPEWNPPPKQHCASRVVPALEKTKTTGGRVNKKSTKPLYTRDELSHQSIKANAGFDRNEVMVAVESTKSTAVSLTKTDHLPPRADPKPNIVPMQTPSGPADKLIQAKSGKVDMLSLDRKEQARRRLEERKKKRQSAGT